ncbi:MAG: hypothetical protein IJR46_02160, partial [Neisseriaceae bacterium]|nr:hypothetical protein [Neisseriaceae bacterium]
MQDKNDIHIKHDDDGFLLPEKQKRDIEKILENTNELLKRSGGIKNITHHKGSITLLHKGFRQPEKARTAQKVQNTKKVQKTQNVQKTQKVQIAKRPNVAKTSEKNKSRVIQKTEPKIPLNTTPKIAEKTEKITQNSGKTAQKSLKIAQKSEKNTEKREKINDNQVKTVQRQEKNKEKKQARKDKKTTKILENILKENKTANRNARRDKNGRFIGKNGNGVKNRQVGGDIGLIETALLMFVLPLLLGVKAMKKRFTGFVDGLSKKFDSDVFASFRWIFSGFGGVIAKFKDILQSIGNFFGEMYNKLPEPVKNTVNNTVETVKNTAKEVGQKVENAIDGKKKEVVGGKSATTQDANALKQQLASKKLIKSNESTAGGKAHAGTYAMALHVNDKMGGDLKYFSAFNDGYHHKKNPKSTHTKGLAFDIVNKSGSNQAAYDQSVALFNELSSLGFHGKLVSKHPKTGEIVRLGKGNDFFIQDEYNKPSKNSSGGHIHFNWGSQKQADAFYRLKHGGGQVQITTRKERFANKINEKAEQVKDVAVQAGDAINRTASNVKEKAVNIKDRMIGGAKKIIASGESMAFGKSPYDVANYKDARAKSGYSLYKGTLQNKTIAQVMQLQASGQIFAAGKYQIIPDTMKMLVKNLGIDVNQKFDAQMQERLGTALMTKAKNRGEIENYVKTGKGKDKAALAFAQEWASIPVLQDTKRVIKTKKGKQVVIRKAGSSYYSGDKAQHSLAETHKMLDELPILYQQGLKLGLSESQAFEYAVSGGTLFNGGNIAQAKPTQAKTVQAKPAPTQERATTVQVRNTTQAKPVQQVQAKPAPAQTPTIQTAKPVQTQAQAKPQPAQTPTPQTATPVKPVQPTPTQAVTPTQTVKSNTQNTAKAKNTIA